MRLTVGKAMAIALGSVIVGCGGPSDEQQIRQRVDDLVSAYANKDGVKACSLMTRTAQQRIQANAGLLRGKDCGATLTNVARLPTGELARGIRNFHAGRIAIDGNEAGVLIEPASRGTKPTRMLKVDGKWYFDGSVALVR